MEGRKNKNFFDCPCLSYSKEFIQNNLDAVNENLYLHTLPYIMSDNKNLNEYKALVSYDIFDVILSDYEPEIQAKFLSSVILNKKAIRTKDNEIQSDYKIFSSEYKYYRSHTNKGIVYGINYKTMDDEMERHFNWLIYTYFIVQNLIRLAINHPKLYSIEQGKQLSYMTNEDDAKQELFAYRGIKTAWDTHMNGALIIFGFVQNLLDTKGWAEIFKVTKYLNNSEMKQLSVILSSPELKTAFIDYLNNKDDIFISNLQNILGYALYAQNIVTNTKHEQAKNVYEGVIISPQTVKRFGFVEKQINFLPLSDDEITFIKKPKDK